MLDYIEKHLANFTCISPRFFCARSSCAFYPRWFTPGILDLGSSLRNIKRNDWWANIQNRQKHQNLRRSCGESDASGVLISGKMIMVKVVWLFESVDNRLKGSESYDSSCNHRADRIAKKQSLWTVVVLVAFLAVDCGVCIRVSGIKIDIVGLISI